MSNEIKERNKKTNRKFTGMIITFIYLFRLGSGFYTMSKIYNFSKYGLEKQARVIEVVKTATGKGGITYVTKLKIDDKLISTSLRYNLSLGEKVSFLVMPDSPNEIILGKKSSSTFDLFAYSVGGYKLAFISVLVDVILMIFLPFVIFDFLKQKKS